MMLDVDALKRRAALAALELVPEGATLGVGTGSTVNLFIEALDGRIAFIGGCIGVDEQFFHRPNVAGLPDLFNFVDGSHTPFT